MFSNEDNKSKILQIALELFSKKGLGESTVDEIVKISGTSKGTFYYYFKGKNQLFLELLETGVEFLISEMKKRTENVENSGFLYIKNNVDTQVDLFIEYPHFYKLMMSEVWHLEEIWHEEVQRIRKRYLSYIEEIFVWGQQHQYIRQDIEIELMGPALFGMIGHMSMHQLMTEKICNKGHIKRAVYSAFFNGILTRPDINIKF
ncbi:TetR/AcrR family transcriptional regulator [Tepidibacillus sp. HK-1]|uniref:TetR/AcrR family transcriptional regulator n=1 Tax=Tepidibacillus sp. HK-1 TaxID=1883407 RepID=UPI000852CCA0|nr:TetR/AcrR family transcriptional regulator [Tepidibacillus sp. HK-1]GBF10465.1 putative HTH-type transcriptional regulator YvdT [Tepidibacillus sp. HK-1]